VEVDGMPDDDGAPPDGPAGVPHGGEAAADAVIDDLATPLADPAESADPVAGAGEVTAVEEQEVEAPPEGAVAARLAVVEEALAALARRYDAEAERAAARERVIDRQHADIERLRTLERVGAMRPVITDLCRLRNDLLRQAAQLPPDLSAERVATLLESFAVSVEDALLRCGVEALPRDAGAPFDPRRQQVARVVEDGDPEQDGTVAEVVQDGYAEIDGGRVVLPARVAVHRAPAGDRNATKEHVDA
jgi:molecular chaperone GrpE